MEKKIFQKIGMWMFAIIFFTAPIVLRAVTHVELPSGWREFSAGDGQCSIAFPSEPSLVQQSLNIADGKQLRYDIYLAPFGDKGVFMLLVATYPQVLSGGHEAAGLEGLLKGIVNHHAENQLVFAKWAEHAGRPAMNFLVESLSNYFRGHAVMSGNQLFLIAMEGRKKDLDEKTFTQFLESFKFTRSAKALSMTPKE